MRARARCNPGRGRAGATGEEERATREGARATCTDRGRAGATGEEGKEGKEGKEGEGKEGKEGEAREEGATPGARR